MRPLRQGPRDPAPSRLAYRMQRLALTPMVRRAFIYGLPVIALALIVGLALADAGRRERFAAWVDRIETQFRDRKEFQVTTMSIHGASETLAADIREVLPQTFPVSSFALDIRAMQAEVAALDAVKRADLSVRPGGTLEVRVVERIAALIWRTGTGLVLIDAEGHPVAALPNRADRPDLPIVSGAGADRAAPEALALLSGAAPLAGRLRGLSRIGERRWDMVLTRGQRVMLPERDAGRALAEVLALDEAEDLLDRDLVRVDWRNPERPTLRLDPVAAQAMRQSRLTELGDDGL